VIEFTLVNAAAAIIGLLGVTFVFNGVRWGWIDEVIIGAILLAITWGVISL